MALPRSHEYLQCTQSGSRLEHSGGNASATFVPHALQHHRHRMEEPSKDQDIWKRDRSYEAVKGPGPV